MELEEYEKLAPGVVVKHEGARIRFHTPNRFTAWRMQTLFTKEPDTIAWIGGFSQGEVLLDVGANVGLYSLFAAATRGVTVYAFEPESQNYSLLNRNIYANRLDDKVFAFCAALSDRACFHRLYLSSFEAGGSCHSFGEATDYAGAPLDSPFAQGCYSTTVDALVAEGAMPLPTHIKIDVDGLEPKVVAGAREALRDRRLRSMLIEINTNLEPHRKLVDELLDAGFEYDPAQVERARRKQGAFTGVGNYVFRR